LLYLSIYIFVFGVGLAGIVLGGGGRTLATTLVKNGLKVSTADHHRRKLPVRASLSARQKKPEHEKYIYG
jgi:hypothetical protein